jgi:hypothetical protein
MTTRIYEASVYSREISYRNPKTGQETTRRLDFALDPMKLMRLIVGFQPKTVKSGNPAINGKPAEISDEEQLKFINDIACAAAGVFSEDGEYWEEFPNFANSLAGMAFLTKLASSDADRQEFAEKAILDPFRAFVGYASDDEGNSAIDIGNFQDTLKQMENLFKTPDKKNESLEERRARLQAEMAALEEGPAEGTQGMHS